MNKDKCSQCGYDKHKGSLHIHHKDGNHENNSPNNLEVLCANCHMEYHHNNMVGHKKRRYESIKEDDEFDPVVELQRLEFDINMYKQTHHEDTNRIIYLQNVLRDILPFREYSKIIKSYGGGW